MSAPDVRISGYTPADPSTGQVLAGLPAAELSTVVDHHTDTASYLLMYNLVQVFHADLDDTCDAWTLGRDHAATHAPVRVFLQGTEPLPPASEQHVSAAHARSARAVPGSRPPLPVPPPGVQPVNRGRSL